MKTITKKQAQKLQTLRKEAVLYQEYLDELVDAAEKITGNTQEGGFTFDYILNGVGLKYTLKALGIRVKG